jgi:hypothetical protein
MKQVLQNLKTGKTELVEVPHPEARMGHILIQSKASLLYPALALWDWLTD